MKSGSAVWHPFTQHAVQPEAIPIAGAEGAWLETVDGRRIFDAISSWWVVTMVIVILISCRRSGSGGSSRSGNLRRLHPRTGRKARAAARCGYADGA
jgi:hypothetical protein